MKVLFFLGLPTRDSAHAVWVVVLDVIASSELCWLVVLAGCPASPSLPGENTQCVRSALVIATAVLCGLFRSKSGEV